MAIFGSHKIWSSSKNIASTLKVIKVKTNKSQIFSLLGQIQCWDYCYFLSLFGFSNKIGVKGGWSWYIFLWYIGWGWGEVCPERGGAGGDADGQHQRGRQHGEDEGGSRSIAEHIQSTLPGSIVCLKLWTPCPNCPNFVILGLRTLWML